MSERPSHARFAPTRWSLVRRARDGDEVGRRALAELCESYWAPVYAFFRREGMSVDDARDLTQGLFAELLERGDVAGGDPGRGRFRSYLLACARHYRSNQRDRERALKRGGGRDHVPIRDGPVDDVRGVEPTADESPEQAYTRVWVQGAVQAALSALEAREAEKGRAAWFVALMPALQGEPVDGGYVALAERLGASESAVKVAVHRLRRRFRTELLRQLGATVEDAAAAEDELRELFAELA